MDYLDRNKIVYDDFPSSTVYVYIKSPKLTVGVWFNSDNINIYQHRDTEKGREDLDLPSRTYPDISNPKFDPDLWASELYMTSTKCK